MVAAMRVMTQTAILGDRCMFPKKRTALLCMTGIAGIVDGRADQLKIIIAAVWIMTVSTGHLPKTKRVTAVSESFRTGAGMAGKTYLLLCQFIQYRIPCYMHRVATDTGHAFCIMHAALPGQHDAIGVTRRANFILRFHRGIGVKCNRGRQAGAVFLLLAVGRTRAVAGFTIVTALCERRICCAADSHRRQEYFMRLQIPAFLVTIHALPGALGVLVRGAGIFIGDSQVKVTNHYKEND